MVAPFPWSSLARVDRRSSRVVDATAAWLRGRRDLGGSLVVLRGARHLGGRVAGAAVLRGRELDVRLADPTAGVVRIRAGALSGYVVAPGHLVRAVAQRVLGGPDELAAPRPLTAAERAVMVVAVAAAVDELGAAVSVEPCDLGGPEVPGTLGGEAAVIDVAIDDPEPATLAVVLPVAAVLAPPRRPLAELAADRTWLDAVTVDVPVVIARARLGGEALAGLRARDVVVAARVGKARDALLAVGRGGLRGALAPSERRVTVQAFYARAPEMDETLGDDAAVDVSVTVGDVRLSVRSLLELRPGQIVELGKPLGSAVELRVGSRVVARGELVDVDGEVGVRVTDVEPR